MLAIIHVRMCEGHFPGVMGCWFCKSPTDIGAFRDCMCDMAAACGGTDKPSLEDTKWVDSNRRRIIAQTLETI